MRYLLLGTALLSLPIAYWIETPWLLGIRQHGTAILVCMALCAFIWAKFYHGWFKQALRLAWLAVLLLVLVPAYHMDLQKRKVLNASGADAQKFAQIGQHLIVGYAKLDEIKDLAQRGYIAGVFVTARNVRGKSFEQLRDELAGLQKLRQQAGLPPLLIATDQEGGTVSRLSPLVRYQPALATLLHNRAPLAQVEQAAMQYGETQGRALAALGVNTNFSPVVDLKPQHTTNTLDINTRISERAISDNPEVVSRVAIAYNQGLYRQGVMPTLKHFPGLGSVKEDTHIGSAHLHLSREQLEQRDWLPFRNVLQQTQTMLMIGHATVDAIDAQNPATLSTKVVQGVIRQEWGYKGQLISDDMSMWAVYQRGICVASQQALDAGIDLLLISYDWNKVYTMLNCLRVTRHDQSIISSL